MQGDSLSAILFIYYLADCLRMKNEHTADLYLDSNKDQFNVDPFYADDTTFLSTNDRGLTRLDNIQEHIPKQLEKSNLQTNATKTERFTVPRPIPPEPTPTIDEILQHKDDKI